MSARAVPGRSLIVALAVAVLASRLLLLPAAAGSPDAVTWGAAAAAAEPSAPAGDRAVGGWVLAARVARGLGDLGLGLALASALAAVLVILAAARLWGDLVGIETGVAAALLLAAAPDLWRASVAGGPVPGAVALVAAAALLWRRQGPARWLAGCVLAGLGALLWPPLAVPFLGLVLAAAWLRREPRGRVALGVGAALATVLVGLRVLFSRGGLAALWHEALLGGGLRPPDPAAVTTLADGLGGPIAAVVVLLLAGLGAAALLDADRRATTAWGVLLPITVGWLLVNPVAQQPGAAWPVATLLAGPVAAALARLLGGPLRALGAAAAVAAVLGVLTVPDLARAAAGHPTYAALLEARRATAGGSVIVADDLLEAAHRLAAAYPGGPVVLAARDVVSGALRPEAVPAPFALVWREDGTMPVLGAPDAEVRRFPCPQGTADCAAVLVATEWSLVLDGPVAAPAGHREVLLQATPAGSWVGVVLGVRDGPAALALEVNGRAAGAGTFASGSHRLHVPVPLAAAMPRSATPATVRRTDGRDLGGADLRHLWVERADRRRLPIAIGPADLVREGPVATARGLYDLELLGRPVRAGRWTSAEAALDVPAAAGALELELAAPRPEPARVEIRIGPGGWSTVVEVGPEWRTVRVPLEDGQARALVLLSTENPFVPGDGDQRQLGVVVGQVRVVPVGPG